MEEDHNGITEIQPVSPEKEEQEHQPTANTHQEFETKPEEGLRKRKNSSPQDEPNSNSNVNGNSASKKEGSTPNVFLFWAFFVSMVSLVTLAFVIISSVVSPGDEKSEFLSMPPDLRSHYNKGKMIKVQIGEERNSIQMFVREEGRRGNAETVVLLHGFGGSSFSFRHVISMLASRGIRAVALDLPGAGFSDKTNLQIDRGWPGFLGRIRNVYLEIKEKGLFWGFDQLIETGGMPHVSYEPKVRKSYQVLQCGAQELGQGLGQVIESLSLGPVHLVVHDTGFETGAIWAVSNPSLVRSVTLLDATSHRPSVPLWVLRMPVVRELMTHFDFLQLAMFKMCCSRSIDRSAAEGHGFLLRTKNGAKAAVEIGSRANSSFDFEGWANADQMKHVPMQILWANGWSKDWQREGHLLAQRLSRAELVFHGGGRWPQEDIAEEITEAIAKFVSSLPPTAKTVVEEPLPEHIQRMFDEGHGHHHDHHDHVHHHGDHGHSHGGGYMDGYGLGHGTWR
uniref:AB hydrolase-1 domain-containing protein n=1 Tax=Araucaria cunninghamii TaxID=56994 RepID=A0A0D6R2A2_ARACU